MNGYGARVQNITGDFAPMVHRFGTVPEDTPDNPLASENSAEALQHSIDLGYLICETDVHASSDLILYAAHDPSLERVTEGDTRLIGEVSSEELDKIRLTGGYTMPRLEQVLSDHPELLLTIDPKEDRNIDPLITLFQQRRADIGRVCIGSFNGMHQHIFRKAFEGEPVTTSASPKEALKYKLGFGESPAYDRLQISTHVGIASLSPLKPDWNNGARMLTERLLDRAQSEGLAVDVWTINEMNRMHELIRMGVDGIQTDQPEILANVAREYEAFYNPDYRRPA